MATTAPKGIVPSAERRGEQLTEPDPDIVGNIEGSKWAVKRTRAYIGKALHRPSSTVSPKR